MAITPRGAVANQPTGQPKGQPTGQADAAGGVHLCGLVVAQLEGDKADNIVTIDLDGKSSIADRMIIASGRSQRHVSAMADLLQRALKDHGYGRISVEGTPSCDWVLLDIGDVIVHLFRPEIRDIYNLERLWSPDVFAEAQEKAVN